MERKELLNKLINLDESIEFLNSKLAKFGWDSNEDLVLLKKEQVLKILNKFLKGKISQVDIENWAEAIECREDIGFEVENEKIIGQIIFDLANSGVTGILSEAKAKMLIKKLI